MCPADFLLSHWQGGGPCAVDVSVVHPIAPSAPVCGVKGGTEAVTGMERVKFAKYADACRESLDEQFGPRAPRPQLSGERCLRFLKVCLFSSLADFRAVAHAQRSQ